MEEQIKISQFLDDEGRVTKLPRKLKVKIAVLEYLAEKFQTDCDYSEQQINEICDEWYTVGDYFTLRRELVDTHLLNREKNGSRYWRPSKAQADTEDCPCG